MNQSVRKIAQQRVVSWLARERDGVALRWWRIAPAVKDDQNQWLGLHLAFVSLRFALLRLLVLLDDVIHHLLHFSLAGFHSLLDDRHVRLHALSRHGGHLPHEFLAS